MIKSTSSSVSWSNGRAADATEAPVVRGICTVVWALASVAYPTPAVQNHKAEKLSAGPQVTEGLRPVSLPGLQQPCFY